MQDSYWIEKSRTFIMITSGLCIILSLVFAEILCLVRYVCLTVEDTIVAPYASVSTVIYLLGTLIIAILLYEA